MPVPSLRYNPHLGLPIQTAEGSTLDRHITILGAGLAGSETAWQAAARGVEVTLVEMRPNTTTPAHSTADFAELVCSNSLKGTSPETANGLLKQELSALGSIILQVARRTAVPSGTALAVDRDVFSRTLTAEISSHPLITVERREARSIPEDGVVVIATGPLTSPALEPALSELIGPSRLSFFDAAAPIVDAATLQHSHLFAASRYGKGARTDYLNCRLSESEYRTFHQALVSAERVVPHAFESKELFHACMPVEEIARMGEKALCFGAMKPVGLIDPQTGQRPFAVLQLRPENRDRTAFNMVGFQTNLTFPEQRRVFGLVPALRHAEFLRYGVMHRNTFVDSPRLLEPNLALRSSQRIFMAGQITGTEGYLEAAGTGLLAGVNAVAYLRGTEPLVLPTTTALGSLVRYATDPDTDHYQPMHVNFGLVPPLDPPVSGKRARYAAYSVRARRDLGICITGHPLVRRTGALEGDARD